MPTLKYRDPADGLWKPVDGFVQPKPQASISASADLATTTAVVTTVPLDTVNYDTGGLTDGIWSLGSARLIVPMNGYYRITGRVVFASNATGYRAFVVRKNGTTAVAGGTVIHDQYVMAANGNVTVCSATSEPIFLLQGDYLTLNAVQTAGASVNLTVANGRYSSLTLDYAGLVGPNGVSGASVTTLAATTDISVAGVSLVPTAWTDLPYQNSWSAYTTAPYQGAQYRKVGDVVEVRGMIKHATTTTTGACAQMPAGFIPPLTLQFQATGSGGGNVDFRVTNTGSMLVNAYAASATGASIALNNVRYSVTP